MEELGRPDGAALSPAELEGAYRMLCCGLLSHAIRTLACKEEPAGEEVALRREAAAQWVQSGGAVTFDDCCEEAGVAPDRARKRLTEFLGVVRESKSVPGGYTSAGRVRRLMAGHSKP